MGVWCVVVVWGVVVKDYAPAWVGIGCWGRSSDENEGPELLQIHLLGSSHGKHLCGLNVGWSPKWGVGSYVAWETV